MDNKPKGMKIAEEQIDKILKEIGIFDEEQRKLYNTKILAAVMLGFMMDALMGKGEN